MIRTLARTARLLLAVGAVSTALLGSAMGVKAGPIKQAAVTVTAGQARQEAMKVEMAWMADLATYALPLEARVKGDTVEVHGRVPDQEAREHVLEIARQSCYLPIRDALQVARSAPRSANVSAVSLARQARQVLAEELGHAAAGVRVTANEHGRITLNGDVGSTDDKLEASRCLRGLVGCTGVNNRLTVVASRSAGYSPSKMREITALKVKAERPPVRSTREAPRYQDREEDEPDLDDEDEEFVRKPEPKSYSKARPREVARPVVRRPEPADEEDDDEIAHALPRIGPRPSYVVPPPPSKNIPSWTPDTRGRLEGSRSSEYSKTLRIPALRDEEEVVRPSKAVSSSGYATGYPGYNVGLKSLGVNQARVDDRPSLYDRLTLTRPRTETVYTTPTQEYTRVTRPTPPEVRSTWHSAPEYHPTPTQATPADEHPAPSRPLFHALQQEMQRKREAEQFNNMKRSVMEQKADNDARLLVAQKRLEDEKRLLEAERKVLDERRKLDLDRRAFEDQRTANKSSSGTTKSVAKTQTPNNTGSKSATPTTTQQKPAATVAKPTVPQTPQPDKQTPVGPKTPEPGKGTTGPLYLALPRPPVTPPPPSETQVAEVKSNPVTTKGPTKLPPLPGAEPSEPISVKLPPLPPLAGVRETPEVRPPAPAPLPPPPGVNPPAGQPLPALGTVTPPVPQMQPALTKTVVPQPPALVKAPEVPPPARVEQQHKIVAPLPGSPASPVPQQPPVVQQPRVVQQTPVIQQAPAPVKTPPLIAQAPSAVSLQPVPKQPQSQTSTPLPPIGTAPTPLVPPVQPGTVPPTPTQVPPVQTQTVPPSRAIAAHATALPTASSPAELQRLVRNHCGRMAKDVQVELQGQNMLVRVTAEQSVEQQLLNRLLQLPQLAAENVKLQIVLGR